MRIAVINVPFRFHQDPSRWITVPPQAYGGIQWIVSHIVDGLLSLGHTVHLLGAPGSPSRGSRFHVVEAGEPSEIEEWLRTHQVDIIHDNSNGLLALDAMGVPFVSTHHLTGRPRITRNAIYSSYAQRDQACGREAPVVRIPVNPECYRYRADKADFLLAMARVSPWKGVAEAAMFARLAGVRLVVAGPSWEREYLMRIQADFPGVVEFRGEVSGAARLELLASARAVMVMSQPVAGPWGDTWCEPGATIVSEAAVSGTPVVSTDNGCLAEIVPEVGVVLPCADPLTPHRVADALARLPSAIQVRRSAIEQWGHVQIARSYVELYERVLTGGGWG